MRYLPRTDDYEEYPLDHAHRLIEPGPTVLISTQHSGTANLMTNGFNMPIRHSPALLGIVLGPWDHSYEALRATRECVVAIPSVSLAEAVVDAGNTSGYDTDKWADLGFTPMEPAVVSAPLIRECFANLECVVADDRLVEDYNLWLLEPVRIWHAPSLEESGEFHHRGNGTFSTNARTVDLRHRMTKWPGLAD
ncbi:flavin reductase family protein [Arthrobacter sp. M2012083]|uniref:flavin reductase family protein n=1 Tax=Arthrobacter sp. M2012083 TaxID=1197706 RepID=UPI0005C85245|nr:flavin reductase family protein [Arthrobacter sp. M2012083]